MQFILQIKGTACCFALVILAVFHPPAIPAEEYPGTSISAGSVIDLQQSGTKIILTDIRTADDYKRFRIPGSINLPLAAIKTKKFLKTRHVVLVSDSYFHRLSKEAKRLLNKGFTQVQVLEGGLAAWQDAGGVLSGDAIAIAKLHDIEAADFHADREHMNWLVVNIDNYLDPEIRNSIPEAVHIPFSIKNDFVLQIKKTVTAKGSDSIPNILIVSSQGRDYGPTRKAIKDTGIANVFYLSGGLDGYKSYIQGLAMTRQPGSVVLRNALHARIQFDKIYKFFLEIEMSQDGSTV